jgi:hypothetical protein
MNLPVLSNLLIRAVAVAFDECPLAHEDVAGGVRDHIVGLIERRGIGCLTGPVPSCLPQRHQQFPVRTELVNLMAHRFRGRWRQRRIGRGAAPTRGKIVLAIGHPDVAVAIHVNAVREHEHAGAEATDEVPDASNLSTTSTGEISPVC